MAVGSSLDGSREKVSQPKNAGGQFSGQRLGKLDRFLCPRLTIFNEGSELGLMSVRTLSMIWLFVVPSASRSESLRYS